MAKRFLTPSRINTLNKEINRINKSHKYPNPLYTQEVIENISTWNDYQKTLKALQTIEREPAYKSSPYAISQARKVAQQFNKKSAGTFFAGRLDPEALLQNSASWKDFQKTLKVYKGFLKKGAETIVGYTANGAPITKWEQEIITPRIKAINARRISEREDMGFTMESGRIADLGNMGLLEIQNPLEYGVSRVEIASRLQSIVTQSQENYYTQRYEVYKNNYLYALMKLHDESLRSDLLSILLTVPPRDLYIAGTKDVILSMDYIYDRFEETNNFYQVCAEIYQAWRRYNAEIYG